MLFIVNSMLLMSFWFVLNFFLVWSNIMRMLFYYMLNFLLCLIMFLNIFYNKSMYWYQYMLIFYKLLFFNMELTWGLDMLSLNLILLSGFLLMFCFLSFWNLKYKSVYYFFLLNFSFWILINVFSSLDFFFFFLFFELIVIPMFFLMGMWGSRNSKISASYQLFLYTLFGSIFIFLSIFDILLSKGNLSFDYFMYSFLLEKSYFLIWLFLFMGFSVKVPMVPFHLWSPEAHVEAPTTGSVILAGILLKLGSYAILSFLLGTFSIVCYDLIFFMLIMFLFSLTQSSIVALCQIDMKKMMAYSSMAHMNYSLMGLFSQNLLGVAGCFIMMFSHAVTSSALFLGMGVLYDSYKTRLIFYYGNLANFMPMFSILYFIFMLSNFGFPGTFNFMGEFLLTCGAIAFSFIIVVLTTVSLMLSLIYSLFLYNKLFYGPMKLIFMRFYSDVTRLEFCVLFMFFILVLFFGIFPFFMFDNMYYYIYKLSYFIV